LGQRKEPGTEEIYPDPCPPPPRLSTELIQIENLPRNLGKSPET